MVRSSVLGLSLLLLAACSVRPARAALCYVPAGPATGWVANDQGRLTATFHGADVEVDLSGNSTRIAVTVENPTEHPLAVRMGGEGTPPSLQIGEVLQRPIERAPGVTGSDYVPYDALQNVRVEAGWRASFFLDSPLGREPSYGQFFVFTVEAQRPSGPLVRRSIPLTAAHVGAVDNRR